MFSEIKDTFERFTFHVRNKGVASLASTIFRKVYENFNLPHLKIYKDFINIAEGALVLEIGGPSPVFSAKGFIPVYPFAKQVDNLNFSSTTIWEGQINEGNFTYKNKTLGKQFIREATILDGLENNKYDIVISSEMIQHIGNPLKALSEWKRVMKDSGHLVLIVPNMKKTFDHRRTPTILEHLIDDFNNNTPESDLTHLEDALKYHDLSRDRMAGNFEQFKARSEKNSEIRALHHHVFDEKFLIKTVDYAGFKIEHVELFLSAIVIIAQKVTASGLDNSKYLSANFKI